MAGVSGTSEGAGLVLPSSPTSCLWYGVLYSCLLFIYDKMKKKTLLNIHYPECAILCSCLVFLGALVLWQV